MYFNSLSNHWSEIIFLIDDTLEWIEIEATWCCSVPYLEAEQSQLAVNRHDMSFDWLKANDIPLATASEIRFDPHPHIGVDVNFNVTKGKFS